MAQAISIGTAHHLEILKSKLCRELKLLEGEGIKVKMEDNPAGRLTFVSCRVHERPRNRYSQDDSAEVLRQFIAQTLSDLILTQWENLLLRDIIRENYYFYNEDDRSTILSYALKHTGQDETGDGITILNIRKKNIIVRKMLEYLRNNNDIVLDGFIRFRLKDYVNELQDAAERALDDFLMEREYREFVQLLKYFVDIQDPRTDMVHVVMKANGVFKIYDQEYKTISSDQLEGFILEMGESEINYEDMLISALITLAPRDIVIHGGKVVLPGSLVDTIKSVFTQRVRECPGCHFCTSG